MLTNSPKISDITKRNIFQLYFPQSDEKILYECCRADFSCVWEPLASWPWYSVLKWEFLDICLITSFPVRNFEMISLKVLKSWYRYKKVMLKWLKTWLNKVKIAVHPGSTTEDFRDYVKLVVRTKTDFLVTHTGMNDLMNGVNTMKEKKISLNM